MLTINTFACDCVYGGSFLKMSAETQSVMLIKVKKYKSYKDRRGYLFPMAIEAEVVKVLKGHEKRKTVIVWGDNGFLCRPYIDKFKVGEYYVMALFSGERNLATDGEKESDYSVMDCGAYWLNVNYKSSTATGDFDSEDAGTRKIKTIKLAVLQTHFLKNGG